jgi:hypothetical protein
MKKFGLILAGLMMVVGGFATIHHADAYVSVRGYTRSNGTYVQPYVRSSPNAIKYDNYGYKGGSLYNTSYYAPTKSYSQSWYTPSYVTDPYYYQGKSLYNSGR